MTKDQQQKSAQKVYVVMNPVAGVLEPEEVHEKIQLALGEHNLAYEIYETTGKEDVRQIVQDAAKQGYDLFLAAGGDGTVSSVASGLIGTGIPMGVIPKGTWNALARVFEIPLEIDDALKLLFEEHQIRAIDAMQVGKEYYLLNVSTGVGARTMRKVRREEKRRFGVLADLWTAVGQLLEFQSYRFEVTIDGETTRFRAIEVMVANSRNIGLKSIELDPEIRMDDGKINVCRLYADSLSDFISLALSIFLGRQRDNWNVLCLEGTREVEIRCRQKNLPVQGDGDLIGRLPVTIRMLPGAVKIVAPPTVSEV